MRTLLLSFFALFITLSSFAQSGIVYGIYKDATTADTYSIIAGVDPLSGTVLQRDTIWEFQAVALGTSNFDQLNGDYRYLAGSFSGPLTWLSLNVFDGAYMTAPSNETLNGVEFDMSSGVDYGIGYSNNVSTFLTLDFETGEIELINTLPEIDAVILGATTFDPVNGIYYLAGIGSDSTYRLYGIEASTGEIVTALDLDLANDDLLADIRFDIGSGMIYGLHRLNNDMHLASVDPATAEIVDLIDISSEVLYFSPGASVFHQETGQFILPTFGSGSTTLLALDVFNESIIANSPIDYDFVELQIDNVAFALANFTSVEELSQLEMTMGPNPTDGWVDYRIDLRESFVNYQLTDIGGKVLLSGRSAPIGRLDLSSVSPGSYLLSFSSENEGEVVRQIIIE